MKRLYKRVVFGCALLCLSTAALQAEVAVPLATDLHSDARFAQRKQLPMLLAFTANHCGYCNLLEEDFLQPMLLSGEYRDKIIMRKLVLDDGSRLRDFSGQKIDATRLSDRYRVYVTPTILFVDGNGKEIAERMVGINTPEMFGGYLDDCIETAWLMLRNPAGLAKLPGCRLTQPAR